MNKCESLLQDASSDPSEQSRLWSHIQPNGIHSPGVPRHVNSSAVQIFVSAIKVWIKWKNVFIPLNQIINKKKKN